MNCRWVRNRIEDYLAGGLAGDLRRGVVDHLASCAACARLVRAHETVLKSLDSAEKVPAPPGLEERIMFAVEADRRRIAGRARFDRGIVADIAAAAAATAGLAVVTIRFLPRLDTLETIPTRLPLGELRLLGRMFDRFLAWLGGGIVEMSGSALGVLSVSLFQPVALPYLAVSIPLYLPILSALAAVGLWNYFTSGDPAASG